ncbi:hypothetical protein AAG906_005558 [Vitis piasezkii]
MNSTIFTSTTSLWPPSSFFPCKTMQDLKQLHAQMIKTAQIRDPLAAAELLRFSALSDHRDLDYARKIFRSMHRPNCFSYNTLIRALSESNDPCDALLVFIEMVEDCSVEPNCFTFPSRRQVHGLAVKFGLDSDEFVVSNVVRMYLTCGVMEDAHRLFYRRVFVDGCDGIRDKKRRVDGDVVLWNVMIDGYVRIGELEVARKLFDEMPQRSVVSWNVMIAGYAQSGHFKEAVEVFREMQMAEAPPNYVTLVSLGKWVHLYAVRDNIGVDDVLGSALIDMYAKCGSIEKALQVFEGLPKRNVVTWSTIIAGLAMHGQAKDARDHFEDMERAGVMPSDVTYIGLLSACSHAGLVDEGRWFFDHMVRVSGLEPRIEHYGCMVDLLGRAGLLEESEELILNMPIKPDDVIWKALLGACKMHGNVEMGKRVAEHLMELAPHDSGSYVALSNIYASSGNWEAVAKVRLMMKEMDVRKDPGCSWIELDGVIHEFLVEDDSHPKSEKIHSMLQEMSRNLMLVGYRPNTTQVLTNMDEEDKESSLKYHSEKIAIAFGLISTQPQTPLRITKNLRICEDCHSSIKLISKIYKRKIIVRDRKRFHHFANGSCSCMDYC